VTDALIDRALEEARVAFACRSAIIHEHREIRCPYSVVGRIRLECDGIHRTVYLKRVKADGIGNAAASRRVQLEYETLHSLFEHFRGHAIGGVPRPLALFAEEAALLTEEVPGKALMDLIGRYAKRFVFGLSEDVLAQHCASAGAWLREFQSFTAQGRARFNCEGLMQYCEGRLNALVALPSSGIDPDFVRRFREYMHRRYREIEGKADTIVGRHNDFSPHNILIHEGRVSVIDFGFFDRDSYLYDLCKFWFQLECMKVSPLYRKSSIDRLQQSFFAGYGSAPAVSDPAFEMVASRYFITRMVTMAKEGMRTAIGGWIDRRSYRWCLDWLAARVVDA